MRRKRTIRSIRLRPSKYTEPPPPPVYDEREARVNELISELDRIKEDVQRYPQYAVSHRQTLIVHLLPFVRRALREHWPYVQELTRAYRQTSSVIRRAMTARDPSPRLSRGSGLLGDRRSRQVRKS